MPREFLMSQLTLPSYYPVPVTNCVISTYYTERVVVWAEL